jgi:hypothetical protein
MDILTSSVNKTAFRVNKASGKGEITPNVVTLVTIESYDLCK